jgi:site-specific recombinase XerC
LLWEQDAAGSNPVAPTILDNGLQTKRPADLSLNLSAQVLCALGEIGRQLQILASAQLGEGDFRVHALPAPGAETLTVARLVNEFLRVKARANRSDRYLRALRNSLVQFTHGRAQRDAGTVTVQEIEDWLHGSNWQPRTMKGYLGDVRTLFNFAIKRSYLEKNPAAGVELPEIISEPVSIHSPEQTQKVLEFARTFNINICRALAVRYFAGLRSIEVERIEEKEITAPHVEITAAKSKTRRRRLVTIQPNLKAWLALGGELPVRGCQSNIWP